MDHELHDQEPAVISEIPRAPVVVRYESTPAALTIQVDRFWAAKETDSASAGNIMQIEIFRQTHLLPDGTVLTKQTLNAALSVGFLSRNSYFNIRTLLERFDRVQTPDDLAHFLQECGPLHSPRLFPSQEISWPDFIECQQFFKQWRLKRSPLMFSVGGRLIDSVYSDSGLSDLLGARWTPKLKALLSPDGQEVINYIDCRTAFQSFAALINADILALKHWRECAYQHCQLPQKLFSPQRLDPSQRYCSKNCQEYAAQQRRRRNRRMTAA